MPRLTAVGRDVLRKSRMVSSSCFRISGLARCRGWGDDARSRVRDCATESAARDAMAGAPRILLE